MRIQSVSPGACVSNLPNPRALWRRRLYHRRARRRVFPARRAVYRTAICPCRGSRTVRRGSCAGASVPLVGGAGRVFARAGVEVAAACGADMLAFGSECGDLDALRAVRRNLDDPRLRARTEELLRSDEYAPLGRIRAFARAYTERYGQCALLERPNDILALEYLAAADRLSVRITPLALKRRGRRDSDGADGYAPAQKPVRRADLRLSGRICRKRDLRSLNEPRRKNCSARILSGFRPRYCSLCAPVRRELHFQAAACLAV